MYELSAFASAPPTAKRREAELLKLAEVVFTSRHGLDEAKRRFHHNVHPLPDSVDLEHFRQVRREIAEPVDQARIGRPRLGLSGVIDESLDLQLLTSIAEARADWQITTDDFVAAAERLMNRHGDYDYGAWLDRVDEALVSDAWDET